MSCCPVVQAVHDNAAVSENELMTRLMQVKHKALYINTLQDLNLDKRTDKILDIVVAMADLVRTHPGVRLLIRSRVPRICAWALAYSLDETQLEFGYDCAGVYAMQFGNGAETRRIVLVHSDIPLPEECEETDLLYIIKDSSEYTELF